MNESSQLLEILVDTFKKFPGIGRKSATRIALHYIKDGYADLPEIIKNLTYFHQNLSFCQECYNISAKDKCDICLNPRRDGSLICVVENIRDLLAIEETGQFRGKYHVLEGVISPVEGVGPDDLRINELVQRVKSSDEIKELIMAISPNIAGDTTVFYISKLLEGEEIKISTLSRGVSFGGELEYQDELTLGRSIVSRIPYHRIYSAE